MSDRFGTDMAAHGLDGPVPDLPLPDTHHAFSRALLNTARRDGMSRDQS